MDGLFQQGILNERIALITGGGTGIGLAVARELGTLGAHIAICGRREEPLETAKAELEAQGISILTQTCDIREDAEVQSLVEAVVKRFQRIDILINNAGGQFPSPAESISPKGFDAVVRNNLLGTWRITHAVANHCMIPQKKGRVVNITANVERGFPGMAHTGAARAGVENLTKTLAVEWSKHGIRVNAVAPGVIVTSGTKQYPPELLNNSERATPLKRLGSAREVSHLIAYLTLPHSDYITGQTIYIDGGASLWGEQWFIPEEVPQTPPYPVPGR